MHFTSDTFVFGGYIKISVSFFAAGYNKAHFGIKGAVILMEFFIGAVLIYLCDIGAVYIVGAFVGDDYFCAGFVGFFGIGTFIDIIENDCGGDFAGDIGAVKNNGDFCFGIIFRFFAEVHRELTFKGSADDIFAGLCYGDEGMFFCFGFGMFILFVTFAVGVFAFVKIGIVIIDDLAADFYSFGFFGGFSVNGDAVFGKDYFCCIIGNLFGIIFNFGILSVGRFVYSAGSKSEHEHENHEHRQKFLH